MFFLFIIAALLGLIGWVYHRSQVIHDDGRILDRLNNRYCCAVSWPFLVMYMIQFEVAP